MKEPKQRNEILHIFTRKEWGHWLRENHNLKKEVWLIYYKKHTGKPRIPYDDAVEEALCYGWIDGKVKRIDDEKFMQLFTPRKAKSIWSDHNKKRAKKLIEKGLMKDPGLVAINEAKKSGIWEQSSPIFDEKNIPEELKAALMKSKRAKKYYDSLAPTYKKQFHWWIISAKRKETKEKRTIDAMKLLKANKKLEM
jgi:uncharacterized protein YdeI (YjbR/CyaY-like superfamily)